MHAQSLSLVQVFVTPWTTCLHVLYTCSLHGYSLPSSFVHGFPRQEYWSGLPFPPPGDLSNPGIKLAVPTLAVGFSYTKPPRKPLSPYTFTKKFLYFQENFLRFYSQQFSNRVLVQSISNYSSSNYSHPAIHYVPTTYLFYNWSFVTFNSHHSSPPPPPLWQLPDLLSVSMVLAFILGLVIDFCILFK